jgi:phage FluMu protein Com
MKPNTHWTDDCCGKKNCDGPVVCFDSRYWPAGGSALVVVNEPDKFHIGQEQNGEPATAITSLRLTFYCEGYEPGDNITLAESGYLKGNSFEDVKDQVETWQQEQFNRLVEILKQHYPPVKDAEEIENQERRTNERTFYRQSRHKDLHGAGYRLPREAGRIRRHQPGRCDRLPRSNGLPLCLSAGYAGRGKHPYEAAGRSQARGAEVSMAMRQQAKDVRCGHCGKILYQIVAQEGQLSIPKLQFKRLPIYLLLVCPRCKKENVFDRYVI